MWRTRALDQLLQSRPGGFGQNRLVGFDHVYIGAGFAKLNRNDVARNFRADEQDALPFYLVLQFLHDGLGHIFVGNKFDFQSPLFNCFLGRRADRSDVQVP